MIEVHYFARYREALQCEHERIQWQDEFTQLNDLRAHLVSRGGVWADVLSERNLMCARNEELCMLDEPLVDGDQVAFFPTVTGG
ncbi:MULTISPECIES: MoaD/ThiS family protein [Pseudomonas]|jgi:molybdopterin synthase sulfur carrier subunit|uniref:Molybdopterin synthase sulfur carrier subunit n=1 Tax=Pseudomonas lutea TaxID=243924 RepID=A0A9X8MC60_9PSED|nr:MULTISPECIES: MoaD/ThiS family protein [Pseudomonas]MCG7372237.1 MoaD/ThiS family protein [Pseudomonas luteola]SEQ39861.1 molybdopterin synthase sulfur carrier subunit [Pseudomonas lutea]